MPCDNRNVKAALATAESEIFFCKDESTLVALNTIVTLLKEHLAIKESENA